MTASIAAGPVPAMAQEDLLAAALTYSTTPFESIAYWLLVFVSSLSIGLAFGWWRERQLSNELKAYETRLKGMVESQGDVIVRKDAAGVVTFVNLAFCAVFDVAEEDVMGTDFHPPVDASSARGMIGTFSGAESKSFRVRYEQRLETVAGWRWFLWDDYPIRSEDGTLMEIQSAGRDITDQKRIEEDLRTARDMAEHANRSKSAFLASMSHEIRTPMNGVLGMTNLILDTELNDEQKTYAQAVKESGEALLALINDILDYSKIEAGKVRLESQTFDVRSTVESVAELLSPRAHEKGIQIVTISTPEVPLEVRGDEGRLRQIILNLAGNAVKFTQSGGVAIRISVASGLNPVKLLIEVIDTGVGVSDEARSRIFDDFAQADESTARKFGGTGLGLAISKRIIEVMDGEIGIESTEGEGSTFWFTVMLETVSPAVPMPLPPANASSVMVISDSKILSPAIAEQVEAANFRPQAFSSIAAALADLERRPEARFHTLFYDMPLHADEPDVPIDVLADFSPLENARRIILIAPEQRRRLKHYLSSGFDGYLIKPVRQVSMEKILSPDNRVEDGSDFAAAEDVEDTKSHSLRILLAEDNEINALLATSLLRKQGHKVDHVLNGREAVEAAIQITYDIILMDVHMPEVDGLSATGQIRALESPSARTPILALTANAMSEDKRRCVEAGMDDFMPKPFVVEELISMLEKWTKAADDTGTPDDQGAAATG